MRAVDNLNLLLPRAPAVYVEHARRVTTFLRLVRDEARAGRASTVGAGLDAARSVFLEHVREQARTVLLDLLRIHLYAELGPSRFLWFGEPAREAQACWSQVEALRDELRDLPGTPGPNERALAVAARLIAALPVLGVGALELRLWQARWECAAFGPAAGERSFQPLLRGPASRERQEALCSLVECALDRGAVRVAQRLLAEHRSQLSDCARAARLAVWCAVLCDDEVAAKQAEADAPGAWTARLPQALVELRAAAPNWLAYLAGRQVDAPVAWTGSRAEAGGAERPADSQGAESTLAALRRQVGASAVAHVRLGPRQRLRVVAAESAPGLRERLRAWMRALEQAGVDGGALEHQAILEAQPVVLHRSHARVLRDAIHGGVVACAALAPYFDEQGEVCGWLRLEWEHHLAPTRARLAELARDFAARWPASGAGEGRVAPAGEGAGDFVSTVEWCAPDDAAESPCAAAFEALVESLGIKTAQRQWWGFEFAGGRLRCAAQGGSARGESSASGGRRGVLRALRSAALVRFDEPRAELSLRADSASGLVLPIRSHGELCGILALESTRRRDFPEALAERWLERAGEFALALRVAQFRQWHRAQRGADVWFGAGAQAWIEPFALAARSNAHVWLCGGRGAGKGVVARWLHFCGARADGELVELAGRTAAFDSPQLESTATVVLEQVDQLNVAEQQRLTAWLDRTRRGGARGPRWIVCSSARLSDPALAGALQPDLRRRLERLQLSVPDLAQRRVEIAPLLHVLAQRIAQDESLAAPTFEDDAIALLWRQAWPANVRELESFVFKMVLMAPGQSLRADDVERIARRFGVELARRVSSRAPDEALVRAALASTANLRGTLNKTRASLYLGWDPDTLVARMKDLGLDEHTALRGAAPAQHAADEHPDATPGLNAS